MSLGGLSPLLIFTFFKEIQTPAALGLPSVKIPFVPIPVYLEERITELQLDDYDRDITIDVMRDGVSAFERVSGDVVNLKFRMQKDNIILTVLTALIDRIIKTFDEQVLAKYNARNYQLTVFYDNIFILDASLERFHSVLVDGTNLREVTLTFSKRSEKKIDIQDPIARTAGTSAGI